MVVLRLVDPDEPTHPVDLFVYHLVPFETAWKRRRVVGTRRKTIPLLSIRDLITLKKAANREQDFSDIRMLRQYEREARKKVRGAK